MRVVSARSTRGGNLHAAIDGEVRIDPTDSQVFPVQRDKETDSPPTGKGSVNIAIVERPELPFDLLHVRQKGGAYSKKCPSFPKERAREDERCPAE